VGRLWLWFIDSNCKLSGRLSWMYDELESISPVKLTITNTCVDNDIIIIDKYVDLGENDHEIVEKIREIDVYNTSDFSHIHHIGNFSDPTFHCLNKMKMVNKMLIIFTTSNYDDKLLTYNLSKPNAPEAGNFRPAGRLPLICADADDKYDLSVYSFSPKTMNLNSLKTGLLVKRIPIEESGKLVAVKIGWPRCVAITAFEQTLKAVQSSILCFNLSTGVFLYKVDIGKHLVLLGHMFCEGHSQIHILEDFIIVSLISEEGISLKIWTHESKKNILTFGRPHRHVELNMKKYSKPEVNSLFKLPAENCQGQADMVLDWDQLNCYQPRRLKQKLSRPTLDNLLYQKTKNICNLRINIVDL